MIDTDRAGGVILVTDRPVRTGGRVVLPVRLGDANAAALDQAIRRAADAYRARAMQGARAAVAGGGLGQPEDRAADAAAALARAADAAVSAVRLAEGSAIAEGRLSLAREYHRRARRLRTAAMDAIDVMEGKHAQ